MLVSAFLLYCATGALARVATKVHLTTSADIGAHCPTTAWDVIDGAELTSAGIIDRCIDALESGSTVTIHLGQSGEITDPTLFCAGTNEDGKAIFGANVEAFGSAAVVDFLEVPRLSMSHGGPLTMTTNAEPDCVSVDGWFAEEADSACGASSHQPQGVLNQGNGVFRIFVMNPFSKWAGMVEMGGNDCVSQLSKVEAVDLRITVPYHGRRQTISPLTSAWINIGSTVDPECSPTVCAITEPITADKIRACLNSVPDHCQYQVSTTVSGTTTHPNVTCEDVPVADIRDIVGGEVLSDSITSSGSATLTLVGTGLPGCSVDILGLPTHTCPTAQVDTSTSSIIASNQIVSQSQTVTFALPDPSVSPSVYVRASQGATCDVQFIRRIRYDSVETNQLFKGLATNNGPVTKSFSSFREITGGSYCSGCSADSLDGLYDYPSSIVRCLLGVPQRCVYLWNLEVPGGDFTQVCTSVGPSAARLTPLQPLVGGWSTATGAWGQPQGTLRLVLDSRLQNDCTWDVYFEDEDDPDACLQLAQDYPGDWTNMGVTLSGVTGASALTIDLGLANWVNVRDWDTFIILVPRTPATCPQRIASVAYAVSGTERSTGMYETIRPPGGSDNSDFATPLLVLPTAMVSALIFS
eukprot:Protomagalhaensia_wolfi_Nauph_80__5744@NODE_698_length_2099_cov_18_458738_g521_i0_p1_GENE_NODE_698_length_2099_cov_18_458738_g521_i0NODE_698_length_2099_cov_18_458738_g521_i0_p1_ORF_typecomplete_len638_score118_17_NODE_698_length_2099_cov_18_458738_g521_i0231936